MTQLILATRNAHKAREFAEILGQKFEVRDLTNEAELAPVEETGHSFEENAMLKAVEASAQIPGLIVADDSGLEVDLLHGAPGIYSARYAGEKATDAENIEKLLGELAKVKSTSLPSARFRCCLALARDGSVLETFEGVIEGVIVKAPRGAQGFGYDPVFQPEGFDRTFAEISPALKNRISHRALAIHELRHGLIG